MPTRLLFEGPDIQTVLTRVYRELGDDVAIVKADKVLVGGLAGFFAKVRYEVVVEAPGLVRAPQGARELEPERPLRPARVAPPATAPAVQPAVAPVAAPAPVAAALTPVAAAPTPVAAPVAAAPTPVAEPVAAPAASPAVRVIKASAHAASPTSIDLAASTLEELAALADQADTAELSEVAVSALVAADTAGGPPPAPVEDHTSRRPGRSVSTETDEFAAVLSQLTAGLSGDVIDFDALPPAPIEPPASFNRMYGGPRIVEPRGARPALEPPVVFRRPPVQPAPAVPAAPVEPIPAGSVPSPQVHPVVAAEARHAELRALGVPEHLSAGIGSTNPHADLVEVFKTLPTAPALPRRPGDVIVVVGDVASALPAARALAKKMRLDPAKILLAADSAVGTGVHGSRRITGPADAERRARRMHRADVAHIVVIDAPLDGGDGAEWAEEIADAVGATQVWAVVDATRKVGDIADQLDRLGGVDALVVERADVTRDPASILELRLPVAVLDSRPATPRAWADLISGRLDQDTAPATPRRRGRRS